jgi:hypothetical protein
MVLIYDDKGKLFTEYVSKVCVQAIVQTVTHRIIGQIHLRSDERVSDYLNRAERFIAMTDVVIYNINGDEENSYSFLAVNLDKVIWLNPKDKDYEVAERPFKESNE